MAVHDRDQMGGQERLHVQFSPTPFSSPPHHVCCFKAPSCQKYTRFWAGASPTALGAGGLPDGSYMREVISITARPSHVRGHRPLGKVGLSCQIWGSLKMQPREVLGAPEGRNNVSSSLFSFRKIHAALLCDCLKHTSRTVSLGRA